jgi:hypothetical protein
MAKNPVLHRQIARRRLLARRLLPNASSRELWQPSCPLQGIAQKVFDLGARHRVVRQCRDMHATLCRLAILTRVTQDISVGSRALALSFPPSASLLIQRWAVLTDTPPALASSAAAGDPSRSIIDATRSLISSRPDPATDHATGTLARNTASVLRCLLYSSLDGEIAA